MCLYALVSQLVDGMCLSLSCDIVLVSITSVGKNQVDRKAYSMIASSKIALPVFGLASYKLRGSILTPSGAHECEQVNSLLHAADTWLRSLEVNLPDFQFFVSHNS